MLHKFIADAKGHPVDYIIVEVNQLFERYIGLNACDILGKRVTEVILGIRNDSFNWIEAYARITYKGEKLKFQQ